MESYIGFLGQEDFLEFLSHTMFESEEWRTIKWEVMLDILVISTSFVSYFELLQLIIKIFTITPHLFQHYSPHTEPTTNEHR